MYSYQNRTPQLAERFVRYAVIDTQSDSSSTTVPSTLKQLDLAKVLVSELSGMGLLEVELDSFGYVYATIPATSDRKVPVLCFCSHMDTSPDCSGAGVKPIIHRNYQGQDLVLPDDLQVCIREEKHPDLKKQHGNDILTASGKTLLGADNKAGIAAIMEAAQFLMAHPEIKHGKIRILFTPDEEIGRGVDHVDMEKLSADFGYTVDGETLGSIEDETFSADALHLTIQGVSAHPGFAKGKMESAIKILSEIIAALPAHRLSPESTSGKEGFVHPVRMEGTVEEARVEMIVRDFDDSKLTAHAQEVETIAREVLKGYPNASYSLEVTEQYRNMKKVLDKFPQVTEIAIKAIEMAGVNPIRRSIRGGTDGSRLSFKGLPCPNIFAGEHAFHSKEEWVSLQDMEKAVQTIINIAVLWEDQASSRD